MLGVQAQHMLIHIQNPEGTARKCTKMSSMVGQYTPGKPQGIHATVPIHKLHAAFPTPTRRPLMNAVPAVLAPPPRGSAYYPYPHQPPEGTPLPALPLKPLKRTETYPNMEHIEYEYCT